MIQILMIILGKGCTNASRGWAGITMSAIWGEINHLFNHHGKTLLSDGVTLLVTATIIFIVTDAFVQLAGFFEQVRARGDSLNPTPNLFKCSAFSVTPRLTAKGVINTTRFF